MTDQSPRLSRRWLYIPFIVAGVILLAYYLLWLAGAAEMKKAVGVWIEDQRAMGMEVTHGAIQSDGFPFFLRVHIDEAAIAAPGEWRWRTDRLSLDALPYDLNRLIFSPTGEQHFSADGIGEWRVRAGDMRASIANDKAREWVFALTIGELHAYREADGATASLGALVLDLAPDATAKTTLVLNLAASDGLARANGEEAVLANLQSVASLSQTHVLDGANPASYWRNAGGVLTITGLNADIEQTLISLNGAIRLDRNNYPAGTVNAEIRNPSGAVKLLGQTGVMEPVEADAAAAGLTLIALTGGGKITAPIELKDGKAQIASVKIANLPRVE